MPLIAVDLDGVVFDFDLGWTTRRTNEGRPVSPGLPQRWNELHKLGGFSSPEAFWDWFFATGGFAYMPVYRGAVQALRSISARGWQIVYLTNRPTPDLDTPGELYRVGLPQAWNLEHTGSKWTHPADLFVEDAPYNLAKIGAERAVRVERPWNRITDYPELAHIPSIPNLTVGYISEHLDRVEAGLRVAGS